MKDYSFPILKIIAVGMLVLSACAGPAWLTNTALLFVPALFFVQGYFFRTEYRDHERDYIKQKLRRIYVPFVGWSLLFILLHNVFYATGIIGRTGMPEQGAYLPYDINEWCERTWGICLGMTGFDRCLCEFYWVFRALLVSALLFLGLNKLAGLLLPGKSDSIRVGSVALGCLGLLAWMTACSLSVPIIPDGGYREIYATLLMSLGYLYRRHVAELQPRLVLSIASAGIVALFACLWPSSLTESASLTSMLCLLLPACAGFILLHNISRVLAQQDNSLRRALIYAGERWFYVLAFSLLACKLSGMVILLCKGLSWRALRQFPTLGGAEIGYGWTALHWLIGMSLPLLIVWGWNRLDRKYDLSPENCLRYTLMGIVITAKCLYHLIKRFGKALWGGFIGFFTGLIDIVHASNPKDE